MRVQRRSEDVIVVLAMAFGLGLAAAILSAVWSLLVQPLPFANPERLVHIEAIDGGALSHRELREIGARVSLLESVASYGAGAAYNLSSGDQPEEVPSVIATRELFEVLGVPLQFGEPWPESFDRQRDFGVVISDRLFRARFGADPAIVGQTITLDAYPGYRVFGVTAPGFEFPADRWMYRSSGIFPDRIDAIDFRVAHGVARMRPEATFTQVQQALDQVARQLAAEFPDAHRDIRYRVRPLADLYVGTLRPAMLLLCVAVALLLALAVVNCAHYFAARVQAQRGRVALELALGAPPRRLMAVVLRRSLLLSLLGALLGLLVAAAGVDLLWQGLTQTLPGWMQIRLAAGPVLVVLALAVCAALAASVLPMRAILKVQPASCLQDGGQRSLGSPRERRQQRAMLVLQVALAFVLVGAGAQFALDARRAFTHPSGFESDARLSFRVALPWAKYDSRSDATTRFYDQLGDRLAALPGVDSVAWTNRLPAAADKAAADGSAQAVEIRLPEDPLSAQPLRPLMARVSEGLFATAGITLLAGRDFSVDDRPESPQVAIVNHGLALRLWPERDPVGARLLLPAADGTLQTLTIVGVVDDVRFDLSRPDAAAMLYVPVRQRPDPNMYVVLVHQGPAPSEAQLRAVMATVDPEQSIYQIASLASLRERQLWQPRLLGLLLVSFALCALILVATGIGGLSRLWATQRRRDLSVRAALGADARRLYRDSLVEVLRVLALGVAIGLPLLLLLERASASLLLLPSASHLLLLPLLAAGLLVLLLLAALPAARTVAASEPAEALR